MEREHPGPHLARLPLRGQSGTRQSSVGRAQGKGARIRVLKDDRKLRGVTDQEGRPEAQGRTLKNDMRPTG